jgi:hypothetical protein
MGEFYIMFMMWLTKIKLFFLVFRIIEAKIQCLNCIDLSFQKTVLMHEYDVCKQMIAQ